MPAASRDPNWMRTWWPAFLVLGALAFAGPETAALLSPGDGGTLSEWTRDMLGTDRAQVTGGWVALTAGLALFTIWYPVHLLRAWPWERGEADVEGG